MAKRRTKGITDDRDSEELGAVPCPSGLRQFGFSLASTAFRSCMDKSVSGIPDAVNAPNEMRADINSFRFVVHHNGFGTTRNPFALAETLRLP